MKKHREEIKTITKKDWLLLITLGIILYTIAQGGQYLGLAYLPSVTVSLILNLGAIFVAFVSSIAIKENPSLYQWLGVILNTVGIIVYFWPISSENGHWLGWFFSVISLLGNSIGSILGRKVNRTAHISPIVITAISMTVGSVLMLITGVVTQGLPPLTSTSVWIIIILAVINTAVCFTIWNYTQQTLTATETTIMNNTMLVHIAILAWIFLGEKQSLQGIIGLILCIAGAMVVQIQVKKRIKKKDVVSNLKTDML